MININNKSWNKLQGRDIKKFLASREDERFFLEFKRDDVNVTKIIKEVSAFANTYGGYIFIGVNDDSTIENCKQWTENKLHTSIHDSITPVPKFDVRKFKIDNKTILVVRVEEGDMPPYITNKGEIYERVSSGSYPVTNSFKLGQLYNKHQDHLTNIKNKIELPLIRIDAACPQNLSGYVDLGVHVVCSEKTKLEKEFSNIELSPVVDYLKSKNTVFGITKVGGSIIVNIGNLEDDFGQQVLSTAGLGNFVEIMKDGSIRCRIILLQDKDTNKTNIVNILYLTKIFSEVYNLIVGPEFAKSFIYAQKYQRLTVIRQLLPCYDFGNANANEDITFFNHYHSNHLDKYGRNQIVIGNRYPENNYQMIEKSILHGVGKGMTQKVLCGVLFYSIYSSLGYVDSLQSK